MAEAIVGGILDTHSLEPQSICISDPDPKRRQFFETAKGVRTAESNLEAVQDAKLVVFCNKPQHCERIFNECKGKLHSDSVVLSICAGVTTVAFQRGLNHERIIRAMPNTPAMVHGAMSVWYPTPEVTKAQQEGVALFLQTFGEQEKLTDEEYLDMATALSGTGPAYFFLLIETLVDAGVHMGFPRNTAEKLVRQTALGSSMYASKFHHIHPTQLRNDITSPGGTTAAALYAAERGNFRNVVTDAVWAAYERSKILGEASNSIVTSGHTHNNKPK
eukprot:CAMPEP_0174283920 /NCGR_PEP_ID=MMETSP0809-20121228/4643_1 /TAXON_ID=73025 ORGANISM="Eutreptiella gymnastica-like, Strain CCMP1594" /NCGR_SAMPLE_ID=MMETSP0809 /ASSEMBLY_ACC=CAM_ASM_000658 /LENGTH=274 /DNA_ID=CAMNT_0015379137 /DNA_START=173 /DNA_END=997 /DNA_ORIENTATION=+